MSYLVRPFSATGAGLVAASGGGSVNFLRADGTWAAPPTGAGSAAWGGITGTLANQTDLQNALNAKANLSGATFSGAISATNLSGTNTGDQTNITGNAGSATVLQTARTINGVSFNGSANITINAVDSTPRLASSAVSSFGLTLIDDANAAAARTTLGLGTLATQSGTFSGTHSGTSSGVNTGDQDLSGYVTFAALNELIDDRVAALLVAGTEIQLVYDDAANKLTINRVPPPAPVASDWTASSANITKTAEADGFYKLEKTGGADGNYTDARAWTNTSYAGDFMLIIQRGAGDGETLAGITDDPAYTYQTHDRGWYSNGTTPSTYDLGFSNVTAQGSHVANDYLVIKRVGTTVTHHKTTDLNNLGASLKTVTDGLTANGAIVIARPGRFIRVKMVAI